jgi:hypothetical protein
VFENRHYFVQIAFHAIQNRGQCQQAQKNFLLKPTSINAPLPIFAKGRSPKTPGMTGKGSRSYKGWLIKVVVFLVKTIYNRSDYQRHALQP